ncbi:MAG: glutathione S-transferase N-terminal domain-containing protein [Pseudomonadota bacterium]|nr:glutathione S-transferase N-terminal domain-containing protein [Pseudomonadota bacterium]
MKLCSTATSPYGRLARMVRSLKSLEARVPFEVVQTRGEGNPFYDMNPSGRVPCLIFDDGTVLEESSLVCWYLDNIDGAPTLHPREGMAGLEQRRLEAMARSMLDGVSLWGREYLYRPKEIRSEVLITHERGRALRLADAFEEEVQDDVLTGPVNMAQLTLVCVLHGRANDSPHGFTWQDGRPHLTAWVEQMGELSVVTETLPPPRN